MIFTTIWTRKTDNYDNPGKSLTAKVADYNISVKIFERTNNGRVEISGEGQHQKEDSLREDEWSVKTENLDNPDYTDEFKILLDKEAVVRICRGALARNLIQISDVIPEELESQIYKAEDDFYVAYENLKEVIEKMRT